MVASGYINCGMTLTCMSICCCSRTTTQMLEQLKHGRLMHHHVALMDRHCISVITNGLLSSMTVLPIVLQIYSSLQSQSFLNS